MPAPRGPGAVPRPTRKGLPAHKKISNPTPRHIAAPPAPRRRPRGRAESRFAAFEPP